MIELKEIHLVLHTHTDIGFTHDQPIVWDLHGRFIEEALDLIEADVAAGIAEAAAFKWTCEAWLPVWHWWQQTGEQNRKRFAYWQQAGRIEVTALPLHLAPLYDLALHARFQDMLQAFQSATGCQVRSAMNCDVNGQHWYLSDLLLDSGISGYSTAINTHFGHCPLQRPTLFRWQTPSGRELPTYNGMVYGFANRFLDPTGQKQAELKTTFFPQLLQHLEQVGWTLPLLMVQGVHQFGDNGSAPRGFRESVEHWNAANPDGPQLRISTMAQWWEAIAPYIATQPLVAGDWTDSWNFGSGSAAKEMAVAKRAQARLFVADSIDALLPKPDTRLQISRDRYRAAADRALLHWTEHTWGADCGVGEPYSEDTDTLWNHKANYAYKARSLANLLRRDSMAALAAAIDPSDGLDFDVNGGHFVVYNPLPHRRIISGMLPSTLSPNPRGGRGDATAGSLYTERRPDWDPLQSVGLSGAWLDQIPQYMLPPIELAGLSWRTLSAKDTVKVADVAKVLDTLTLDNGCLALEIDPQRGGLSSLRLRGDDHEWIDRQSPWAFGGYVRETIDPDKADPVRQSLFNMDWLSPELVYPEGWNPQWPALRAATTKCLSTRVVDLPDGYHMIQKIQLPHSPEPLDLKFFLPHNQPWLEVSASWIQAMATEPEAHYLTLPFALPEARARVDLGGMHINPEIDQIPGVTNDFFTAGRWVDFHNAARGVTIALPENPLCQLGEFRFGRNQKSFQLEQPLFLGWIANNYWDTNFRAHQPGKISARYRIYPYAGAFDADSAQARGDCAAFSQPQVHPLSDSVTSNACLPSAGTLLKLRDSETASPCPTVRIVDFTRDSAGHCIVRLFNDSDHPRTVSLTLPFAPTKSPRKVLCPPRKLADCRL